MHVYTVSLKGARPQNEDNHIVFKNLDNNDPNFKDVDLFGVFDGHGGKQVSSYIKDNLPRFLIDKKIDYPISKKYVSDLYDHLQTCLKGFKFSYTSGSTGLVVIRYNLGGKQYINVINNGDCRLILCRDNFAMPLTKDHKPMWPEEKCRIEKLGGKIEWDGHDWRIGNLSVSRAFGDCDSQPFVTHRPELLRYELNSCDKFIVLACDGLYDVLQNHDIVNFILLNCYDCTGKRINQTVNIAKKLGEHAIEKHSSDNISVIVVFLDE